MRAVLGGQRSTLGVEANGERQSGVGESLTAVAGRGGNGLLLQNDSERIRRTGGGCMRCVWSPGGTWRVSVRRCRAVDNTSVRWRAWSRPMLYPNVRRAQSA
jgi:hypothetical protein